MKKLLIMFSLAVAVTACNNAADSTADAADSIDSMAAAKKEKIDSMAEEKKDVIDSTAEQKKAALEGRDSANRKDTSGSKK
ncbi:MAG TPA: hypothetical protein VEZ55_06565 [Chitinophagaceae bacterium]|jgi:hypothetical protein|nr:hypothetical protein [Chitinophagaceae bacterium]